MDMSGIVPAGLPQMDFRREWGSYYTPRFVTRSMLHGCLAPVLGEVLPNESLSLRILDPACGNGAFILEAFDYLHDWYRDHFLKQRNAVSERLVRSGNGWRLQARERLRIVREHLFGVDIDPDAIHQLQARLCERVEPDQRLLDAAQDAIRNNFRLGDALTGPDFQTSPIGDCACGCHVQRRNLTGSATNKTNRHSSEFATPLDWCEVFEHVAANGGFDVVLGNPPYRRELNAKSRFDRIANSPLGRKWRQARMDLWYYFLHRGLDLLRTGGRLSFIVNSYWTASTGARKLIERLERETSFEEIVVLDKAPIFADVAGRHLIFRLRKANHRERCRVIDLTGSPAEVVENLPKLTADPPISKCYQVSHSDLFQHGQLSLGRPEPWMDSLKGLQTLGESYDVRQGMAENPPSINAQLSRKLGECYKVGEGVFVLAAEEVEALELSAAERAYLRPYYRTSAVGRYRLPTEPTHAVLYLTKKTAPTLDHCQRLRTHLERFRPIMERRRETRNGSIKWWQLHWPRAERIFTEPRILSVQMGRVPQFVWTDRPTFVGFSINLILAGFNSGFTLTTLTGILNSTFARRWFSKYAKRRGLNLEINGKLLRRFPLPKRNNAVEKQIDRCVLQRHSLPPSVAASIESKDVDRVEKRIDALVCLLYGVALS